METITAPVAVAYEECHELKNIKYKTMLLSGVPIQETKATDNIFNLDSFLETEKNNNKSEPWGKLDKTEKIKKIMIFSQIYKETNEMNDEEIQLLINFLKDCLDRKRLTRVKDVIYDKTTGLITEIPALHFNKSNKHFTLKNTEKRISTLKSLPPKKVKTIKNTSNDSDDDI